MAPVTLAKGGESPRLFTRWYSVLKAGRSPLATMLLRTGKGMSAGLSRSAWAQRVILAHLRGTVSAIAT